MIPHPMPTLAPRPLAVDEAVLLGRLEHARRQGGDPWRREEFALRAEGMIEEVGRDARGSWLAITPKGRVALARWRRVAP